MYECFRERVNNNCPRPEVTKPLEIQTLTAIIGVSKASSNEVGVENFLTGCHRDNDYDR